VSYAVNSLEHHWMPFTANRSFKAALRLLVRAEGMYYWDQHGNKIMDGCSKCAPKVMRETPATVPIDGAASEMTEGEVRLDDDKIGRMGFWTPPTDKNRAIRKAEAENLSNDGSIWFPSPWKPSYLGFIGF